MILEYNLTHHIFQKNLCDTDKKKKRSLLNLREQSEADQEDRDMITVQIGARPWDQHTEKASKKSDQKKSVIYQVHCSWAFT